MRTLIFSFSFIFCGGLMTGQVLADDSSITLKSLTNYVYQQAPARLGEASLQSLSDARRQRADHLFADAATLHFDHFNDAVGSGDGLREWETAVSVPLWLPGQKRRQQNWAQETANQLPYYQQLMRLQASGDVRSLVWNVMQAAGEVRQAETTLENAQALQQSVSRRVAGGDLAETEQLLADSNLLAMRNRYQQSQSALQRAVNQYHYLTGQRKLPSNVEEAMPANREISAGHPQLAILNQKIAVGRSEMANARFRGVSNPQVSLGVKRERDSGSEPYNNALGLGFSLPLGDNPNSASAVAESGQQIAELEIERQNIKRALEKQLIAAMDQLRAQQDRQALLREQYQLSESYLQRQQKSFDFGQIDLQTLLRIEVDVFQQQAQIQSLEIQIGRQVAQINQILGISL